MVKTTVGTGCVLAMIDAGPDAALRYKVQLPFGVHVAYIRPSSIAHHLSSDMECVRHGGFMDVLNPTDEAMDTGRVKTLKTHLANVFLEQRSCIYLCGYIALSLHFWIKLRINSMQSG